MNIEELTFHGFSMGFLQTILYKPSAWSVCKTCIGTRTQPKEWHQVTIKSISKNLRKKMEMQYKRGLFLSNIISKCTERITLNRRQEAIEASVKPMQFGGITSVSVSDNLFIFNNVIALSGT